MGMAIPPKYLRRFRRLYGRSRIPRKLAALNTALRGPGIVQIAWPLDIGFEVWQVHGHLISGETEQEQVPSPASSAFKVSRLMVDDLCKRGSFKAHATYQRAVDLRLRQKRLGVVRLYTSAVKYA